MSEEQNVIQPVLLSDVWEMLYAAVSLYYTYVS